MVPLFLNTKASCSEQDVGVVLRLDLLCLLYGSECWTVNRIDKQRNDTWMNGVFGPLIFPGTVLSKDSATSTFHYCQVLSYLSVWTCASNDAN